MKGKKLSDSEGIGTTGKVFESQKEALDFGKKEVVRLTNADKKPRQLLLVRLYQKMGVFWVGQLIFLKTTMKRK